jgi:pimeloyl-ACP methyl ester carboxylesterase
MRGIMAPSRVANSNNAMQSALRFAAVLAAAIVLPASAAVSGVSPSGFLVTHKADTNVPPTALFAAIVQPARWWSPDHTYSKDAANLKLPPLAGACFCESWGDRNAVEHARVIGVMPGKWLRLQGALGPLQEMAVTGVLDFRIAPRGSGSTLTVTYRVRGSPDAALDKIAPGVDKVLGEQVQRLAAFADAPAAGAKPLAAEEAFFEAGSARVRFLAMGKGEPVILLHDAGVTSEAQWVDTGVMRGLAENYRALALDAREPDDVARLMDHLGIGKAHLVGYGMGAQQAAKFAVGHPERLQTLTLAGATSLRTASADPQRKDLVVPDETMTGLPVPTLGIVGMQDPAMRDFVELKQVMPRLVRMNAIENATHQTTTASPDFTIALMYFLRYNPMPSPVPEAGKR